jgi:hypothetical protein
MKRSSLIVLVATFVSACGGGGAGPTVAPSPVIAPDPPSNNTLTIVGNVSSELGAGATVSTSFGGSLVSTTSGTDGSYELTIEFDDSEDNSFIVLTSVGAEGNNFIEYRSALGEFSSLVTLAGSDATLSADELFTTNLSPLTTAAYGMAVIENKAQAPSSKAQWDGLARNVNSEEVLMAASAIQLVVDSRDSMPDMMPSGSTLDLVSSSSSLNNVVKRASESDDSLLAQTKSKVLADDNAVDQQRPAQLYQLYLFEPGYRSLAYDFYSNGFGTEFTNGQGGARSISWVYEGNEISLTYDNLIVSGGIDMIDVDDDGIEDEVYFEIVQLSSDITFVSEREGFELVNITREFSKRYPDYADLLPEETYDHDGDLGAGRGAKAYFGSTGERFEPPVGTESWVLPLPGRWTEDFPDGRFYRKDIAADFITLEPGNTGFGRELGSFIWQVDGNGHLVLQTDDLRLIEYQPLDDLLWAVIETGADGSLTGMNVAKGGERVANSTDITPGFYTLEWSWLSDFNSRFWIEINEDGSARSVWTLDVDNDGAVTEAEAIINTGDWLVDDDRVTINFYRNSTTYEPCASDVIAGCVLYLKRYFDLFAVQGDRYIMGHTHNFFDYIDEFQTRYIVATRHWVREDEAPITFDTNAGKSSAANKRGMAALPTFKPGLPNRPQESPRKILD